MSEGVGRMFVDSPPATVPCPQCERGEPCAERERMVAEKGHSIVKVRWRDSSEVHGWTDLAGTVERYASKPLECVSIGYAVSHTTGPDGVLIIAPHMTGQDEPDAGGVMTIPATAVIEVVTLTEAGR